MTSGGLTHRAPELPPSQQVEVKVKDVLTGVGAAVHQEAVAGVSDASFGGDARRGEHEVADQLPVLGGHRVVGGDVLERDEEDVHRGLRADVVEGHATVIPHHELRGDLPIPDLAEHAVGHGGDSAPADSRTEATRAVTRRGIVVSPPGACDGDRSRCPGGGMGSRSRWLLLCALAPSLAVAEPRAYRVASVSEGSKAEAVVSYSLGTHLQTAQEI